MAASTTLVGFIGLGALGRAIARRVLDDGNPLLVWNRTAGKEKALVRAGAEAADDIADIARRAPVILSCLADDEAFITVAEAIERAQSRQTAIHIAMTTASPAAMGRVADSHQRAGLTLLAAPVLGRPDMVADGSAKVLLSGPQSQSAQVRDLLKAATGGVIDLGENVQAAAYIKLALNYLVASAIASMGEAFTAIEKAALDPEKLYEIATAGPFSGPLHKGFGRLMLDGAYRDPQFRLALGLKDVRLFRDSVIRDGATAPLGAAVIDVFRDAVDSGDGDLDWSGLIENQRRQAGLN